MLKSLVGACKNASVTVSNDFRLPYPAVYMVQPPDQKDATSGNSHQHYGGLTLFVEEAVFRQASSRCFEEFLQLLKTTGLLKLCLGWYANQLPVHQRQASDVLESFANDYREPSPSATSCAGPQLFSLFQRLS